MKRAKSSQKAFQGSLVNLPFNVFHDSHCLLKLNQTRLKKVWMRLPFVDVVHAPSIRVDIEALNNLTEVVTVLKLAELDVCPT